jgi:hypothetical protein
VVVKVDQCGVKWQGVKDGSCEELGTLQGLEWGHPNASAESVSPLPDHNKTWNMNDLELEAKFKFQHPDFVDQFVEAQAWAGA